VVNVIINLYVSYGGLLCNVVFLLRAAPEEENTKIRQSNVPQSERTTKWFPLRKYDKVVSSGAPRSESTTKWSVCGILPGAPLSKKYDMAQISPNKIVFL
jgi:hypothetical protein